MKGMWIAWSVVAFLAVVLVGRVLGEIAGASESNVTGALAPLVFSLLGVLGIGASSGLFSVAKVVHALDGASSFRAIEDENIKAHIVAELSQSYVMHQARGICLAIGVVGFCFAYRSGASHGTTARLMAYPRIQYLLRDRDITLTPEVTSVLYEMRWTMRDRDIHPDDYTSFFTASILPILISDVSDENKRDLLRSMIPATP